MEACYQIAGNTEFFPIAYRVSDLNVFIYIFNSINIFITFLQSSRLSDSFFLRLCNVALGKLFKNNLKLSMPNGKTIEVTVKFQVANYKTGQLQVRTKFLQVLRKRAKNLIKFNGLSNVLSLNNLAKDADMEEMGFNLGSNAVFSMLATLMCHYQAELFSNVTGLLLANNGIRQMSTIKMLSKQDLKLLDISNNKVRVC